MPGTVPIAAGHADYSEGKGFLYMFFFAFVFEFLQYFLPRERKGRVRWKTWPDYFREVFYERNLNISLYFINMMILITCAGRSTT